MKVEKIKIYHLYEIDKYGRTIYRGRYASLHRTVNAARGLGLERYFLESEEKQCEYGGTLRLTKK
jgi:hypothetical protein